VAPTTVESSVSTVEDAADALQTLRRFSLAALSGETEAAAGTLQVHALVQRVVRESLDADEIQRAARAAAGGLLQTWPDADYEPRNALLAESLRASTTLLEAHCSAAVWSPDAHPVLFRAGRSLRDAGLTAEAVTHWRRLAGTAADLLGADHPDTLASRNNLASAYRDAGRREEALALFERTLADCERRLGADHPDTLTSRNNLASAYQAAGRLEEALPLFERTLADRERRLGADHPALAALLYSIAAIELELSDARSAVRRLTRATAIDEHAYGPQHPEVATDLEALAGGQRRIGDVAAAISSLRRALEIRRRDEGPAATRVIDLTDRLVELEHGL
jgi:tetratricopeptide (TPR) repeat protein